MKFASKLIIAVALLSAGTAASASISDPVGDFLPTYAGPANPDVDILSGNVVFDGTNFYFSESANGAIGSTPNSLFVWAVNRGGGIARPAAAPPAGAGILWDAVVVMFPDGTLRVVTFPSSGPPTTTNLLGGTTVSGNSLSASLAALLLPSTGFAPADYTFSLWSRVRAASGVDGPNTEVADLLSGSGSITATSVPEPATWLSMLLGFTAIGLAFRRTDRRPGKLLPGT